MKVCDVILSSCSGFPFFHSGGNVLQSMSLHKTCNYGKQKCINVLTGTSGITTNEDLISAHISHIG